ncbi:serine hydrolase domain-containing protein [Cytobacillus dafuensis]|nr:serine hydrolase domain-containing protein [Cytobacillus dafuensis]
MNKVLKFEKIFNKTRNSKLIHEGIVYIEDSSGNFSWIKGHGGKDVDSPLLMASITKLFTTACILILQERGKLSLNNEISEFFNKNTLSKLHFYKSNEYSFDLCISDLLFQVSGLPDKFEEKKNSTKKKVINEDFSFSFDELLNWTKQLKPHFAPQTKGKAYYSDINFDILGEIIENVNGTTLAEAYQQLIFAPLQLEHTYLPQSEGDFVPNIYYKDKVLKRPKFINSCRASGGAVSTAREMMIFIKAFFGGKLFNKAIFNTLACYNKLQITMWPISYGGGYMRIALGGFMTPFVEKGELLGHSGSTGSFAFYYPQKDLFFVGDVNQFSNPALPIRLTMQLAMGAK